MNLAAALAQQGKDVLVIDERTGDKSVSALLAACAARATLPP